MKKVRRIAENIIILCLVVILGISGYNIYTASHTYSENRKVYKELPSKDFDKLKKQNPDVVAWITYKPFDIDYPIVQGEDNEKYLNIMFNGEWGGCGCLFVDCICENPFIQFNTIVYGHHMYDGSMFAKFGKFKDKEVAEKDPKMQLYLPNGSYDLEIWAFLNEPSDSEIYLTNLEGSYKDDYIKMIEDKAEYTLGKADIYDRLVVLSTCAYEYEDARYQVICKMKPMEPEVEEVEVTKEYTAWELIKKAVKLRLTHPLAL